MTAVVTPLHICQMSDLFHCIINDSAVFWHLMRFQTRGSITHTGPSWIIFNHFEQHTSNVMQPLVFFLFFFYQTRKTQSHQSAYK